MRVLPGCNYHPAHAEQRDTLDRLQLEPPPRLTSLTTG
jgi:hypothetical protein